jgi:serine/threonine protein kinase
MSPEQCLGLPLDRRSDVFSLGIVLYELCTARRLFKRSSSYQTFEAITHADVPPPRALNPKIDPAVEAVILKSLARQAEDRYPTAGEMQEALEQAMHKAGLRGARNDLQKFVEQVFAQEMAEQSKLLADAQKGRLATAKDPRLISAVAEQAEREEQAAGAAASPEAPVPGANEHEDQTTIDLLPPLGQDSGRHDSREAPGGFPPPSTFEAPKTQPEARRSTPTIYYVIAVAGVLLLAAALAWLMRP